MHEQEINQNGTLKQCLQSTQSNILIWRESSDEQSLNEQFTNDIEKLFNTCMNIFKWKRKPIHNEYQYQSKPSIHPFQNNSFQYIS